MTHVSLTTSMVDFFINSFGCKSRFSVFTEELSGNLCIVTWLISCIQLHVDVFGLNQNTVHIELVF